MKATRLDYISILRVLCIIVVVFFHCYGMMYAESHFPNSVSAYESLYFLPNQCIFINVAMPMFVLVSGYLFAYLLMSGKYPSWGILLRKKGLRILLPYFVFGLFFMATTGGWDPLQLLNGGYWHLWFLPMLFWCFVVGYAIYRTKSKVILDVILILLAFVVSFFPKFFPTWLGLHNITCWFYWFYLGMLFYKYKDIFSIYSTNTALLWGMLFVSLTFLCIFPVEYGEAKWYSRLFVTFSVFSIVNLMCKVNWSKMKFSSSLVKFSSYCFGIYIWHNWVALMLISNTSKRLFGLQELAANHVILFPLCFSLITLAISWGISWCMMKTKVGRFLIG